MKRCYKCQVEKPHSEFWKGKNKTDGLASYCKPCANESSLDAKSRYRYGLSRAEINERVESQGGVCRICQTKPSNRRGWHFDHDHSCCPGDRSCGKCFRGMLCGNCNVGLGHFNDKPELLRAAASYLEAA